jgi:hypothetical protein
VPRGAFALVSEAFGPPAAFACPREAFAWPPEGLARPRGAFAGPSEAFAVLSATFAWPSDARPSSDGSTDDDAI